MKEFYESVYFVIDSVNSNALCFTSIHVVIPLRTGGKFPLAVVL